jgi:hypothetical protein
MALDLAAIVRRLKQVEARHPDAAAELEPVIEALTGDGPPMIGTEQARKILGVRSVNTVKRWLELGILGGVWDERRGRWQIPLDEALRLRSVHDDLAAMGGDDMTPEELEILSSTRPGTWPWERSGRA